MFPVLSVERCVKGQWTGPVMTARLVAFVGPAVALLLSSAVLLSGCRQDAGSTAGPAKNVPVKVAIPQQRSDVAEYEDVRGQTKAFKSVDLYCHVSGYLQNILFKDGAEVAKGDLLFEIDDGPFKAALDRARADLDVKIANRKFREAELARNKSLPLGAISQSELDKSVAALEEAAAEVTAGKAAVETAELNWKYTKINAPISGRISKAAISEGNLVVADSTLLSHLVSQDPIYVEFSVDEQIYNDVQDLIRQGKIEIKEKQEVPVYMKFGKETDYLHTGKLNFADNVIKEDTGTYLLRAEFKNPADGRLLIPNMTVDVRISIGPPKRALLVAEQAIGADLDQKYVLVLNDKNEAEKRAVKLGTIFDGLRVVEEGLTAKDRVIVVGKQNVLQPGVVIEPQEVKMQDYAAASGAKVVPPKEQPVEKKPEAPAKEPAKN